MIYLNIIETQNYLPLRNLLTWIILNFRDMFIKLNPYSWSTVTLQDLFGEDSK